MDTGHHRLGQVTVGASSDSNTASINDDIIPPPPLAAPFSQSQSVGDAATTTTTTSSSTITTPSNPQSQSSAPNPGSTITVSTTSNNSNNNKSVKKRIRKPRGRGLRTKTGCLTCRKRHKKCDEQLPTCSHCATSNRECVWPDPAAAYPGADGSQGGQDRRLSESHSRSESQSHSRSQSLGGEGHPRLTQQAQSRPQTSNSSVVAVSTPRIQPRSRASSSAVLSPDDAPHRPARPPPGPVAPTQDYGFTNGPSPDSHNIVDPALAALYPQMKPKPPIPEPFSHTAAGGVSSPAPGGLPPAAGTQHDSRRNSQHPTPRSPETVSSSGDPANAGSWTTRWLDLLASDAAQADSGFSLAPSALPRPEMLYRQDSGMAGPGLPRGGLRISNNKEGVMGKLAWEVPETHPWQETADIELQPHEALLFRSFAEKTASWLDLFDPYKHFSTYAIRLAIRNVGLIKAILALQARYAARTTKRGDTDSIGTANVSQPAVPPQHTSHLQAVAAADERAAVQYYQETLHYVSTAMQYQSYAHSEELLATALVISTYEMLDAWSPHNPLGEEGGEAAGDGYPGHDHDRPFLGEAISNWQRHLKGVFWIQRSQDVNGATGGLRQAVWWAWLRQDLFAALRERRRCLSFWRPVIDYPDLTQTELAYRAIYLLSQAVNYCALSECRDPGGQQDDGKGKGRGRRRRFSRASERGSGAFKRDPDAISEEVLDGDGEEVDDDEGAAPRVSEFMRRRTERGAELMAMLERWRSFLGDGFRPLPSASSPSASQYLDGEDRPRTCWQPIWIHPPQFAVALQVHSFARILVSLHRPDAGGRFGGDQAETQRILDDAVATICGIAMELVDQSSQIISSQCLFGAGLCVHDPDKQEAIITMIERCEESTGWPTAMMRADLRRKWARSRSRQQEEYADTEMKDV